MAKKKVSRKQFLKAPDEFMSLSSRVLAFVKEQSRYFEYLGMALAAIILIYVGINTYLKYINKKGQNVYNTAYSVLYKNMNPDMNPKELKRSEELFKEVRDRYGLSKVSQLALPELAYIKFLEKKYDEAISLYQKFLNKVSQGSPYQSVARLALAACYEEKGEFQKAVETLEQIMSGPDALFKEQAMQNLARDYRLAHQEEKSKKILKEFIKKYKNSRFLPIAKAQLDQSL
jgi:outer membrane protein assembly factor BamD (BamD/ComL family)